MTGKGHPLPASEEARHAEIPEHLEREKGCGDDPAAAIQPGEEAVNPDGEPYPYEDTGRGPSSSRKRSKTNDIVESDQAAHQDRGQSAAETEAQR